MNNNRRHEYYRARAEKRKRLSVSGMASVNSAYGTSLKPIPAEEEFYILLTGKSTTDAGVTYSWARVTRDPTGSWAQTGQTGGPGFDPAYEANNADSPINQVYRAYREPNSGQLLFF